MGKLVEFKTKKKNEAEPHKSINQRAYLDLFKRYGEEKHILYEISKDVGSVFNILNLPKELMMELVGAGTLKILSKNKNIMFNKEYAERLVEALEYLDIIEETSNVSGR